MSKSRLLKRSDSLLSSRFFFSSSRNFTYSQTTFIGSQSAIKTSQNFHLVLSLYYPHLPCFFSASCAKMCFSMLKSLFCGGRRGPVRRKQPRSGTLSESSVLHNTVYAPAELQAIAIMREHGFVGSEASSNSMSRAARAPLRTYDKGKFKQTLRSSEYRPRH